MYFKSQNSIKLNYPFGSVVAIRSYSSGEYRFGFQGQEKDDEVSGSGNIYSYKFRMNDTRLGRFFSTDPLYKAFPWNSPYSFSENRVIDAIEMEGGEKLKVVINGRPSNEKPGSAKIIISLDYMIVTKGHGAVTDNVNPEVFKNKFAQGNTTIFMMSLPTPESKGTFLSNKHTKWAEKADAGNSKFQDKLEKAGVNYYKVDVEYKYTATEGGTIQEAIAFMNRDEKGRGIIMEPIPSKDIDPGLAWSVIVTNNNAMAAFKNPRVGGYAMNETEWQDFNIIVLNPKTTMDLPSTERAVHEAGHNSAANHVHKTFNNYEYNQKGLQSNQSGLIYPTVQNTKAIINDNTNRQTTETEDNSTSPPSN